MSDTGMIVPSEPGDESLLAQRLVEPRVVNAPITGGELDGVEPPPSNPLGMVLRTLRGRLVPALGIGIVMGSILAIGGYNAKKPSYSSGGLIQVLPTKTNILYNDRDDSRLRLFDSFANAESLFITSTPVMELAVEQSTLKQINWPGGMAGVTKLKSTVTVERKGGLIFVTASDESAEEAAAIVNATLNAYIELHHKQLKDQDRVRERELGIRERDLVAKLEKTDRQMLAVGQEYGSLSIASAHIRKIAQAEEVDQRVSELEMSIATKEASETENAVDIGDQELKRLMVLDHAMADMLFERSKIAGELSFLEKRHAKENREVVEKTSRLEIIDKAIEDRRTQLATLGSVGAMTKSSSPANELADLRALRDRFVNRHRALQDEAKNLNERLIRLEFLSKEREQTRTLIEETRKALEQIRVESQHFLPGTVQIKSYGAVSIAPSSDKRLAFGAAGAMVGLFCGFAMVIGYGLAFRRYRFSDELAAGHPRVPLVGVLPDREDKQLDQDPDFQEALHRLAVDLQLRSLGEDGTEILAVTGTRLEAGSSTVALGLARTFAAANVNTVLVDADLNEQAVTKHLGLEDGAGFREVLMTGYLNGELPEGALNTLRVLPAGKTGITSDVNISRKALSVFLQQLRQKCDLVVLDLGQLTHRNAARLGVALSDHVVLVVPAGDKSSEIQPAINAIETLAPNRATSVLNFAAKGDPGLPEVIDLATT